MKVKERLLEYKTLYRAVYHDPVRPTCSSIFCSGIGHLLSFKDLLVSIKNLRYYIPDSINSIFIVSLTSRHRRLNAKTNESLRLVSQPEVWAKYGAA